LSQSLVCAVPLLVFIKAILLDRTFIPSLVSDDKSPSLTSYGDKTIFLFRLSMAIHFASLPLFANEMKIRLRGIFIFRESCVRTRLKVGEMYEDDQIYFDEVVKLFRPRKVLGVFLLQTSKKTILQPSFLHFFLKSDIPVTGFQFKCHPWKEIRAGVNTRFKI